MDEKRIKELLHAWRPGQEVPSEVARARDAAAADPALSAWLDNERAFDQAFADQLRRVKVPVGLLDDILAEHMADGGRLIPFPQAEPPGLSREGSFVRSILSLAASLLIVAGVFVVASSSSTDDFDQMDSFVYSTVVQALGADMQQVPGMDGVAKRLLAQGAPVPQGLPVFMSGLQPDSCGVIRTQRGNIAQIGFSGSDDFRLLVVERRCVGACSRKLDRPVMFDMNDRIAVAWANEGQVYILVSDRSDEGERVVRDITYADLTEL
jgi:hypothetical protein